MTFVAICCFISFGKIIYKWIKNKNAVIIKRLPNLHIIIYFFDDRYLCKSHKKSFFTFKTKIWITLLYFALFFSVFCPTLFFWSAFLAETCMLNELWRQQKRVSLAHYYQKVVLGHFMVRCFLQWFARQAHCFGKKRFFA